MPVLCGLRFPKSLKKTLDLQAHPAWKPLLAVTGTAAISDGSAQTCLSSIIWPDGFEAETRPQAVLIEKGHGESLVASAISDGVVLKQSQFREGEDFEFTSGRIELKRDYAASGAREPGNPFIGIMTSKTMLGLNASGQGRISQSTTFAGTGFLIIPIAGSTLSTQQIERFPPGACSINGT